MKQNTFLKMAIVIGLAISTLPNSLRAQTGQAENDLQNDDSTTTPSTESESASDPNPAENSVPSDGPPRAGVESVEKRDLLVSPELPSEVPAPDLTPVIPTTPEATEYHDPNQKLLALGARFDVAYASGNSVQEGFSIPSLRLSAYGGVGDYLNYRLSFGETREYSTAMLPQLLPMEAFVSFGKTLSPSSHESQLTWKIGMFTPTANPWWTPDLGQLNLPTYNESQRALLLPPDVGTELCYQPWGEYLTLTLGMFNGNGNFSLNVNNSKAFSGFVRATLPIGSSKLSLGSGVYQVSQSSAGDNNYISNWASDTFLAFDVSFFSLSLDLLSGTFVDSIRSVSPVGGAGFMLIRFAPWFSFFTRIEALRKSPKTGGLLQHGETGPMLEVTDSLKAFILLDYLDLGDGAIQQSLQVRVRLVL